MGAIIQGILAVKGLIEVALQVAALVKDWSIKHSIDVKNKAIEHAQAAIQKASEIKDAALRRKAKAEAECELEKAIDPNSDCSDGNSSN